MNKFYFYLWCFMAACGIVASFYNPGHLWFTFVPSAIMAIAMYPERKEEEEKR